MGYIKHNAIIVTSYLENNEINQAHEEASKLEMSVSNIVGPAINGFKSFLIGPDGSKEGWESSKEGDIQREKFKAYLSLTGLHWIEVRYGGDDSDINFIVDYRGKEDGTNS